MRKAIDIMEAVRELRHHLDLTQTEFAARLGKSCKRFSGGRALYQRAARRFQIWLR